jgi:hypothetical protein
MTGRLFIDGGYWTRVRDGDARVFEIFRRHYTFRQWRRRNGPNGKRIAGPGETIVLLGIDGKAIFIWKRQLYSQDGQLGVNCVVFRNEGTRLSSELLAEAEEIARARWPGERLFTYVNPQKVQSRNPGYCFKRNGWRRCGITKARKLHILEKLSQ